MKRMFSAVPLVLALAAGTTYSQETSTSQRYAQALYIKVAPGKDAALIEHYKTGAGGKAIRGLQKANSDVTGWALRQVLYPGENAPDANYVIVSTMNAPPRTADPAKRDETYRAATGMSYADYMTKVRTMSEVVGSSLFHIHDTTPGLQMDEGDVVVARRMKTSPGKGPDYTKLMRTMRLPLVTERTKLGRVKGFAFSHIVFGGSSLPWDATETMVYKDLPSAVGGPGAGPSQPEIFAKVHPGKNLADFQKSMREAASLVRTDVYRVVVVIRPDRAVSQLAPARN